MPDIYAFCEWLFSDDDYKNKLADGDIKAPDGLLIGNQVYSSLFHDSQELDMLRSPHLYKEHAVRQNVMNTAIKKWFIAKNAIYTSSHDLISKILMFDVDGDKLNVISDETMVEAAKRNIEGINPLYYEMNKAKPQELTKKSIADNLELAYQANIGKYSDAITKILNSNCINWDAVKWLVMENNFEIDRAKTLFMVTRPTPKDDKTESVDEKIKKAVSGKMPYFIRFAREKETKYKVGNRYITKREYPQTEQLNKDNNNNSTVNKIVSLVPSDSVKFKSLPGTFNVKYLMSVNLKDVDIEDENSKRIITAYEYWDKKKHSEIKADLKNSEDKHKNAKSAIYIKIRDEIIKVDEKKDVNNVVNVLVKYLFKEKIIGKDKKGKDKKGSSEYKKTLWASFGKEILQNIHNHVDNTKQCQICGDRFHLEGKSNAAKYCEDCSKETEKNRKR